MRRNKIDAPLMRMTKLGVAMEQECLQSGFTLEFRSENKLLHRSRSVRICGTGNQEIFMRDEGIVQEGSKQHVAVETCSCDRSAAKQSLLVMCTGLACPFCRARNVRKMYER
ncbi:hypothetical protein HN011_009594 [Eciton burchellii]|nr:hypothetical protein HN011_009594 [Eciton burchellii]